MGPSTCVKIAATSPSLENYARHHRFTICLIHVNQSNQSTFPSSHWPICSLFLAVFALVREEMKQTLMSLVQSRAARHSKPTRKKKQGKGGGSGSSFRVFGLLFLDLCVCLFESWDQPTSGYY